MKKNIFVLLMVCSQAMASIPEDKDVAFYPESSWGSVPAKVTKELILLQHPHLKAFAEAKKDLEDRVQGDSKNNPSE